MWTLKAENQLNASRLAVSWLSGGEIESENRPKIAQKTEYKMDGILASIFLGFWSILGAKLGAKIDQSSIQKGIEKRMQKRMQQK